VEGFHQYRQSSVVKQVFNILLRPLLPVWVLHCHHNLPNHMAFEFFSSLLLVYLSFCLQYFLQKSVRLKTWPIHQCFLRQTEFNICLSAFNLLITSSLVTLSSQRIFSILLHIHISKASNLLSESTSTSLLYKVLHSRPSISLFFPLVPD